MRIEHKDFIGYYHDLYPQGYCQHLIQQFDALEKTGVGSSRQDDSNAPKHHKDDHQIYATSNLNNHNTEPFKFVVPDENGLNREFERNVHEMFFQGLQRCYDDYAKKYSVLLESGNIRASAMKMQRTGPGGGYHLWHGEQGSGQSAARVLVYMLYLNTIPEEGAETEFLYQQTRVKPQENLMLFWPAAYTHAHRGNPVLGKQSKYIVTGWFYFD
jgi:hypothetical protein